MQKLTFAALAAIAVVLSAPLLVSSIATPASALECRTPNLKNAPPGEQDKPLKEECGGNKVVTNSKGKPIPGQN
jgi:hypothetical protein